MALKTDLEKFQRELEDLIEKSTDRVKLKKLGNFVLEMVKQRTRDGFGVPRPNARKQKLKPLTSAYIRQRERMRLSPFTSPRKSNLTRSGRMLAGLRVKTKNKQLTILPTGRSREGVPNDQVADFVQKQGRPFLFLSNKELDKTIEFFEEKILAPMAKNI